MICVPYWVVTSFVCGFLFLAAWLAARNINNGFKMLAIGIDTGKKEERRRQRQIRNRG